MTQKNPDARIPRNTLARKQAFALMRYTEEHYAASRLNDKVFAERATEALGFTVTDANVSYTRDCMEIASNVVRRPRAEKTQTTADRLALLEQQVADMGAALARSKGTVDSLLSIMSDFERRIDRGAPSQLLLSLVQRARLNGLAGE